MKRGSVVRSPARGTRIIGVLHLAYDLCYLSLVLLLFPVLIFKLITKPRLRAGFAQRIGRVPRRESDRPCLWVHGVSVGEVKAAGVLMQRLPARLPGWEFVLSTTTRQGYDLACREHPDILTIYYPLDFSFVTRRAIRRIRPAGVVLMELELWPNFLLSCDRHRIPVGLVNGRISERSYKGYRRARRFLPEPHQRIQFYAVQNEEYAERIRNLGVAPGVVHVTGQMKYDTIDADPVSVPGLRHECRRLLGLSPDAWVVIGGSTHPSEENALLQAARRLESLGAPVRLILVPRHMERLGEVEEIIRRAGKSVVRRTDLPAEAKRSRTESAVVLVNTIGELAKLYAAADLVFVGGSLIPHGGQSMIEPAALGLPVVFGPHVWNFADSAEALLEAEAAIRVEDREDLCATVERLYQDPELRDRLGQRAREVVDGLTGATERNLDLIVAMLGGQAGGLPQG